MIIAVVIIAIFAPLLTPYNPRGQRELAEQQRLANDYAVPIWFKILPQYRDYNPTIILTPDITEAKIVNQSGPVEFTSDELRIDYMPTENSSQEASVTLDLGKFNYEHSNPPCFQMIIGYKMFFNTTRVNVWFILKNYTTFPTWEYLMNPNEIAVKIGEYVPPSPKYRVVHTVKNELELDSAYLINMSMLQPVPILNLSRFDTVPRDPSPLIFANPGVYGIQVKFEFFPTASEEVYAELYLEKVKMDIWGRIHGILGTDFLGNDVWTELVYGARISLIIGILAAVAATTLGILYGVLSGYLGGFVDEFLMRIVDVLLCIPVLPILLVLTRYFRPNVYYIVILIAIFGWQGLSRVIRSRVLSLKEMAFIESAKASGASDRYLITRHLVPNVLPIAMSAMVLAVPGAILTEAALTFLGFGDLNTPTWGRILHYAYQQGGLEAWFVWIPPGLAICFLCVGFVFMGHAIDEIVNPRLRRRR